MAFSHVSSVSSVSLRSLLFNNFVPFEDCQPVSRRMSFNSGFSDAFASLNRGDIFLVRIEHTEAFFSVQPTRRWPVSPCLINNDIHCGHWVKMLFAGLRHLFSLCNGWSQAGKTLGDDQMSRFSSDVCAPISACIDDACPQNLGPDVCPGRRSVSIRPSTCICVLLLVSLAGGVQSTKTSLRTISRSSTP